MQNKLFKRKLNNNINFFDAGKYLTKHQPDSVRFNQIFNSLVICFISQMVFICMMTLVIISFDGIGAVSLVHVFSTPTILIKVVIIPLQCYITTILFTNITIQGVLVLIYLVYISRFLTQEMCLGLTSYRTDCKLRISGNLRIVYRSFQILHEYIMRSYELFLVACNGVYMYAVIYFNFTLIRYWSELHPASKMLLLFSSIGIIGFWLAVLELGRRFFVGGKKLLQSWKGRKWEGSNIIMKKFVCSCRPILVSYGKQFVVGSFCVLNYFRGVVRGTQRVLLASKR